ncbi:hypothetical protein GEMRC1_009579 [Eukaryota sp. GEM-RC1]
MSNGGSSFIMEYIKKFELTSDSLQNTTVDQSFMDSENFESVAPESMLTQTGYLTITSYDVISKQFTLDFPNREVESEFSMLIVHSYWNVLSTDPLGVNDTFLNAVSSNNTDVVIEHFIVNCSGIPHPPFSNMNEDFYHSLIYCNLLGCGFDCLS